MSALNFKKIFIILFSVFFLFGIFSFVYGQPPLISDIQTKITGFSFTLSGYTSEPNTKVELRLIEGSNFFDLYDESPQITTSGNDGLFSFHVGDLFPDTTYSYVVYDPNIGFGTEDAQTFTTSLQFSDIQTKITHSSFSLSGKTSEPNVEVELRLIEGNDFDNILDFDQDLLFQYQTITSGDDGFFSFILKDLSPNTTYSYLIDIPQIGPLIQEAKTFTTEPWISDIQTKVTPTSFAFSGKVPESDASIQIDWSNDLDDFFKKRRNPDSKGTTSDETGFFEFLLKDLSPDTTYSYIVYNPDVEYSTDDLETFTTPPAPTAPPSFKTVSASEVKDCEFPSCIKFHIEINTGGNFIHRIRIGAIGDDDSTGNFIPFLVAPGEPLPSSPPAVQTFDYVFGGFNAGVKYRYRVFAVYPEYGEFPTYCEIASDEQEFRTELALSISDAQITQQPDGFFSVSFSGVVENPNLEYQIRIGLKPELFPGAREIGGLEGKIDPETGEFNINWPGLEPQTTYYYQLCTLDDNPICTVREEFTTEAAPAAQPTPPPTEPAEKPSLKIFVGPIVPKCNTTISPEGEFKDPCTFDDLMQLANNIINFLLFAFAMPIAAIAFAYIGFLLLTAGGSEEKITKAKKIFWNVLLGFVIALAAWLIVNSLLTALGLRGAFRLLE